MKLVRYGPPGAEKPGILDALGNIRDLSAHIDDIGPDTLANRLEFLADLDPEALPQVNGKPRLGPPAIGAGKIICVGVNYPRHAEETAYELPDEPLIFMKATTAINGPNDPVVLPPGSTSTDWEVELAVVIGKTARSIDEDQAYVHVAGYCIANDVSERDFQLKRHGQWVKGKSCDSFAPLGPWLVTHDEIGDPHKLDMWLDVNDHRFQDSNTGENVFSIPRLVSYISHFMTLLPGDIISTGTPAGIGMAQDPPVYLKAGDVMRLGIQGLGEQCQQVVAWEETHR